jgi:steroid delta-isomerase-like uncharacterized protein
MSDTRRADVVQVVQRYFDAVNARDIEALDRMMTSDFVYHGQPSFGSERLDGDAHKRFTAELVEAFPDTRIDVQHTVVEGDSVCIRYLWTGTHTGAMMGAEPTGRAIAVVGLTHLRVVGDQVAEEWEQVDTLGLMQQLGLVPATA